MEFEDDIAHAAILGVSFDLQSQFPAHFQHDGIFLENLAVYAAQALGLAYSMISCIRVQPKPRPLRSDLSRIAYSPVSRVASD
jgi:chorismate mutase